MPLPRETQAACRVERMAVTALAARACARSRPRLARGSDGPEASGIDSELGPVPKSQLVCTGYGYGGRGIDVGKAHGATRAPASRQTRGSLELGGRRKQRVSLHRLGGERQQQAQAALQALGNTRNSAGDGDCCVRGSVRNAGAKWRNASPSQVTGTRSADVALVACAAAVTALEPLPWGANARRRAHCAGASWVGALRKKATTARRYGQRLADLARQGCG